MHKLLKLAGSVALAAVLFATLLSVFPQLPAAAEPAQQTGADVLTFAYRKVVLTTDAAVGPVLPILPYDTAEMQYTIDISTANTVTLKLEFSNDGVNWANAPLTTLSADGSAFLTPTLLGRWGRVRMEAAQSDPYTLTVIAVGK